MEYFHSLQICAFNIKEIHPALAELQNIPQATCFLQAEGWGNASKFEEHSSDSTKQHLIYI